MEASEFEARKQELMEECTVPSQVLDRLMPRLERFMVPFIGRLARKEQIEHARTFCEVCSQSQKKSGDCSRGSCSCDARRNPTAAGRRSSC
jgi:hypothetical protein